MARDWLDHFGIVSAGCTAGKVQPDTGNVPDGHADRGYSGGGDGLYGGVGEAADGVFVADRGAVSGGGDTGAAGVVGV